MTVLWIVYAASYFIRICYAAAIAPIVAEGHFSKGEIGLVGTAFFICYGAGQLISGLIGDKVNPFFMLIFGAATGGLCCFFASCRQFSLNAVNMGRKRLVSVHALVTDFKNLF